MAYLIINMRRDTACSENFILQCSLIFPSVYLSGKMVNIYTQWLIYKDQR